MVEAQGRSRWLQVSGHGVYCSRVESYVTVDGYTCPARCFKDKPRSCPLRE